MEADIAFNPQVSIIIPVYNGANYMAQAIDSALAQTYKNLEIIVVNDGSRDEGKTERIALSYGDKIRYFCKENGGVGSTLNLGVCSMTGDYFSWLSHDDVYCPNKIEAQVDFLRRLGKRDVILYSDWDHIDGESKYLGTHRINHKQPVKSIYMVMNCLINGCTLLVPKRCFDEVGLFNERLETTQDYDLWFKMARRYEFVHMPEVLIKYRIHPEQDSIKHPNHVKEENTLHTGFNKDLSREEILSLEKSEALFFIKRALFYQNTPFSGAQAYTYGTYRTKLWGNPLWLPAALLLEFKYLIKDRAKQPHRKKLQSLMNAARMLKRASYLLINPLRWKEAIAKINRRLKLIK